ncbi:OLC1v1028585C1 [Oldenlandia corymbosa var. corymbosa]|uniref:OLC1v1028585C1 n=1 Tax=Oldenlandia corymbosa var. corymbosa TaxID=529605 RepID=A0AAV1CC35_OLDCO|nr:OLC1v1028585C1 [Oldenlandia corymbosa var. corymbosa]
MDQKNKRHIGSVSNNRFLVGITVVGLFAGAISIILFIGIVETPLSFFCNNTMNLQAKKSSTSINPSTWMELQRKAIVHYATSRVVPQQSLKEIQISLRELNARTPCNFLVFGLGHDSIMWASLNPGGSTLFLEEDPKWVDTVLRGAPHLRAHTVKYRTQLSQADELLDHYRAEPECWPNKSFIHGNQKCRLALNMLPEEVYEKEWDLIMIDAPRGYFPEAPGRMSAIYSAAVMARNRKGSGVTHVFLHDVDRKVEKVYSDKFLCPKYLKESAGKLRHFEIPAAKKSEDKEFC